jgi:hypothetical protein
VQPDHPDDRGRASSGKLVDAAVMAERRALRAELAEETLQQRAAAAERAVVSMEARLSDAEAQLTEACAERDALAGELVERERALRSARQGEFAERMVRRELEGELAAARRAADAEIAGMAEHVDVLAAEAERLEGVAEQARRAVVVAERRLAGERDVAAAAAAEAALVRQQVGRRLDAVQGIIGDLREELEDRVVAERGRAAVALVRERELWEAALEAERRRADTERAARHRAEAELGARVAEATRPPSDLGAIRAIDLRGLSHPQEGTENAVAVAETVIADLARAADRLRAEVDARAAGVAGEPAGEAVAGRRRRRWWRFPWHRPAPTSRASD